MLFCTERKNMQASIAWGLCIFFIFFLVSFSVKGHAGSAPGAQHPVEQACMLKEVHIYPKRSTFFPNTTPPPLWTSWLRACEFLLLRGGGGAGQVVRGNMRCKTDLGVYIRCKTDLGVYIRCKTDLSVYTLGVYQTNVINMGQQITQYLSSHSSI